MYAEVIRCVDCGKEFTRHSAMQVRCPECQEAHRKENDRIRKSEEYARKRETKPKTDKGAVIINGHPQVCTHMGSCYYGSVNKNGCSYLLETGKSRIVNGYYIENGKCPCYTNSKGRRRMQLQPFTNMPRHLKEHNFNEV